MLEELDCKIHSLKDNFDTSTAVGSFSMYLVANLAQFERKQIAERISANFLSRAKRGLYNGGAVPLGYRATGKKDGRLEIVPSEAETVREIFKTFLAEGTLASATRVLNAKKVQIARKREGGGKTRVGRVMPESLYRTLTNKSYIGVREYKDQSKVSQTKALWEPIVNEEVFIRVGEMLKANKSRKKSSPKRFPFLISGLLFCQCGLRLSGKSAHGNGGKVPYYDHSWQAKIEQAVGEKQKTNCYPVRVLAKLIEPVVWRAVKDFLLLPEFFAEILLEAKEQSLINTPEREVERKLGKIYEINMQLDALSERLGMLPKSVNPKHVFDQMEKLSLRKSALEDEVAGLRAKSTLDASPVKVQDFEVFREAMRDLLENESDPTVKTSIIQKVVDKIIIKNEEVELYFLVGAQHYKRELDFSGSRPLIGPITPDYRYTPPLPVFHGNQETAQILNLNSNFSYDAGSNSLRIGGPLATLDKVTRAEIYYHDNISFFAKLTEKKIDELALLYQKGCSLREISRQTGLKKTTISKRLKSSGLAIRSFRKVHAQKHDLTQVMRTGTIPFGYCYLEGKLVVDPHEYKIVLEIYRLWQSAMSLRAIARSLNDRKIPTRFGKSWKHMVIKHIIERHQKDLDSKSGGRHGT